MQYDRLIDQSRHPLFLRRPQQFAAPPIGLRGGNHPCRLALAILPLVASNTNAGLNVAKPSGLLWQGGGAVSADSTDRASIESAFFGLDNSIGPLRRDGLVVSFDQPIDSNSLDHRDFVITDADGVQHIPSRATLMPANEATEGHSVLLLGEFGDAGVSDPVTVDIVGDLVSQGASSNLRGQSIDVTPLDAGPSLFHAQLLPLAASEFNQENTGQVLQVAWTGGITPATEGLEEDRLNQYYTVYTEVDGELVAQVPLAIGDINDNDNYHQLYVDTQDRIVGVAIGPGVVVDPNGDLNAATSLDVYS